MRLIKDLTSWNQIATSFLKKIHILLTWILSIRRFKIPISIAHHSCLDMVVVTFLASVKASLKSCTLMPWLNLHKCSERIKLIALFNLYLTRYKIPSDCRWRRGMSLWKASYWVDFDDVSFPDWTFLSLNSPLDASVVSFKLA